MRRILLPILGLSLACGPVRGAGNMIRRHGADGLAFTDDDPLRVCASWLRGMFFVGHNWVDTTPMAPANPDFPEDTVLIYLDPETMTTQEITLLPSLGTWSNPKQIRNKPESWTGNEAYIGGNGFRHRMDQQAAGAAGFELTRDTPALRFDPDWFGDLPGGFLFDIKDIRLEEFSIREGFVMGALLTDAGFTESLTCKINMLVGRVHALVKILILGEKWYTLGDPVPEQNPDPNAVPDPGGAEPESLANDPEFRAGLLRQVEQDMGVTGADASLVRDRLISEVQAAERDDREVSCANIQLPSITDPGFCGKVDRIVQGNGEPQSGLQDTLATDGMMRENGASLVQTLLDNKLETEVENGKRVAGWLDWKKPLSRDEMQEKLAETLKIQSRLSEQYGKLLGSPVIDNATAAPASGSSELYSGSFLYNSLYFYGPAHRWFIEKDANNPGLVEDYVYSRINRLNPYQLEKMAPYQIRSDHGSWTQDTYAPWERIDLITAKPFTVKTMIPWPPPPEAIGPGEALIVGDEAAAGLWGEASAGAKRPPEKSSMLLVAIRHRVTGSALAGSVTSGLVIHLYQQTSTGKKLVWVEHPRSPIPVPSAMTATSINGPGVHTLQASVLNRLPPATGYEYHWTVGDQRETIVTQRGRTTRAMATLDGVNALCYVRTVDGRTGLGLAGSP